ncbi:MAG: glycosyltransferase family 2 protein [Brasilonema sp.]
MAEHRDGKPLVSVIITFFNTDEKFFIEAIESVFAQIYDNWELLLVDDGSTNESTAIALRYAQQYPQKVSYLEHEGHQNRGISSSRNLGIHNAKGEYIALLDADDIWLPQKLEKQVEILEAQPEAGMVFCSTLMWYSWTGKPEDANRNWIRVVGGQLNTLMKPPTLLKLLLQRKACTPGTCSVLLRAEVTREVGGFEESFRGMYEDTVFFSKVYLKVPVFVQSGYLDRYRQHPNSTCHLAEKAGYYHPSKPMSGDLIFLNWLEKYLVEQEVKDIEIWQAFKTALWPFRHPILYDLTRQMKQLVKLIVKRILPVPIRLWLQFQWHGHTEQVRD